MRVLVCGGRKYDNGVSLYGVLGRLHREHNIALVINGGAPGADSLASKWAKANGVPCQTHHAKWDRYGRRAGPIRNALMLDQNPDIVIAFPGGAGTADMVRRAQAAGVIVRQHMT